MFVDADEFWTFTWQNSKVIFGRLILNRQESQVVWSTIFFKLINSWMLSDSLSVSGIGFAHKRFPLMHHNINLPLPELN